MTGPRQSGKTTLVRSQLAHGTLRSLGDQGTVDAALGDPSGFLAFGQHGMRVFALAGMAEMMHYMADGAFGDVSMRVGDDLVATAEIRRPPDNFFDAGLIAALADAYEWAGKAGARAIMLCSEGKHFCAGADFTGRSSAGRVGGSGSGDDRGNGRGSTARTLYDQALRLFESPLPVVAAVQGAAVGGGLGLACSADFRVASPQARFAANFARLGLHQGFALSATLPAIVGQQHAWDLLYTGRRIGGDEAAAIGLADRLADAAGLREAAHALAAQLAESAPLAIRAIRATMREGLAARVRDAMDHELAEQEKLWPTADFAEGVRATAERRTPRFEGR
ncbi:MAG TPA: enoyl-CoA hydratase/isomerase family protein [Streptosporangiaceae bacterium]|nr:enoyl-CoA hydratase/isomerase family protein [Streptosporangiaceae bacterium]